METQYDDEVEIDLKELFLVMLGNLWLIIALTVIGAVAAILITTLCITPMYESSSSLYILSKSTSLTSLTDIQLGTQLTKDYMVLAKSRTVVNEVIDELDLDMTYEEFLDTVTITNETDTRILTLSVRNQDAQMAKVIVDTYAETTARQTAKIMDTETPNVVDKGVIAETPVSPSLVKNTFIGALIAFVLAVAVLTILYLLNDTVKTPDDAEKYLGLTNLGSIPEYERNRKSKRSRKEHRRKKSEAASKKAAE